MKPQYDALVPAIAFNHWSLSREPSGLAWLSFDRARTSANTLSSDTLDELNQVLDLLDAQQPTGLIVQSAKKHSFIVGADIHAMSQLTDPKAVHDFIKAGGTTFDRISALPYPTLALIDGACLGGGLELALACRRRIVVDTPETRLGLPEVKLGIVPGWGGMRRLPATIGAPLALDLMLTGRTLDADRAVRAGLADFKVAPRLSQTSAQRHVLVPTPPRRGSQLGRLLNLPALRRLTAKKALKTVDSRDPYHHYPAPRAIIDI